MRAELELANIGLFLRGETGRLGYDVAPVNADTFAETGGDGTHYSFLHLEGTAPDAYPVVMTVPMNLGGPYSLVVGENLRDFLALGCECGYFWLEQLLYDRDETIRLLERGNIAPGEVEDSGLLQEKELLRTIRERFELSPWKNVDQRLKKLAGRFAGAIVEDHDFL